MASVSPRVYFHSNCEHISIPIVNIFPFQLWPQGGAFLYSYALYTWGNKLLSYYRVEQSVVSWNKGTQWICSPIEEVWNWACTWWTWVYQVPIQTSPMTRYTIPGLEVWQTLSGTEQVLILCVYFLQYFIQFQNMDVPHWGGLELNLF